MPLVHSRIEPILATLAALAIAIAGAVCLSELVAIGAVITAVGAYLFGRTADPGDPQSHLGALAMALGVLTAIAGILAR